MLTHILGKENFKGHSKLPKTEAEILEKGGPRPGSFRCALVFCHCQFLSLFSSLFIVLLVFTCLDVLVYLTMSFHSLNAEFTKKATMISLNFLHIFKWPSIGFLRG